MKNNKFIKITFLVLAFAMMLTGCAKSNNGDNSGEEVSEEKATETTVEITDVDGTVTVPVNPKRVISLDNRTYETLSDWGIELAAVPKEVMPSDSPYVKDENVQDIGNHREPNLEIIAAIDPELVIIGQRFGSFYEDIKALVPNATIINLNFDVSGEDGAPGESLVEGLKNSTVALGKIFDKNEEAEKLIADFEKSIEDAKVSYNSEETVMSIVVSGGEIGFSAPGVGRVWGPMYEIFGWKSALEIDGSTTDHKGDDISVEAIAESNPDWIFVLDRDAATSSGEDSVPAQDVVDNSPALKNTTAISKGQIIYAPKDTYTNESIQTYIELFENMASSLAK
ncbi:siderophore ABC transporter substrate-binding protein [Anaerosphaera multitolerans]|uniref:Iron ABC transporter substrate-binding protein n=1 Tax=Anaerosphaera multitolerans TaxID=2487351 RepID=A0A437S9H2_9FIRM|nr:ABC transporter substrate-binding protein [Anaerosphaera multitolerans]RVU55468.1 iron ABC transporter substrate-binding protein [Anaerosphaera multitolerans]